MLNSKQRFIITGDEINQRLDVFLTAKLEISRAKVQKLIENSLILVNSKKVSKHYNLKIGDVIKVQKYSDTELQPAFAGDPSTLLGMTIKIVKETNDYLIVNKPAGIVVHPAPFSKKCGVHPDSAHSIDATLIGNILYKFPDIKKTGKDSLRPGIVHRLDKDVSGVMTIARTQKMFNHLKKQFKNREIKKEYLALVHGQISKNEDIIEFSISRKKSGFMAAKAKPEQGRISVTKILTIKRFKKYTLIKAYPLTGRTHQIRVHLHAYNHPIVGEEVYINKKFKKDKLNNELNRLFLHAHKIGFYDLKEDYQEFIINLPGELDAILKEIS